MSVGITPPSSLIRTHAPVLNPPRASVTPRSLGLCRLLSAPAGRRTFPVLSLRLFLCVLGPLPRLLLWCLCPFLPTGQRPSRREDPVGAWQKPVQQLQYGTFIEAAVICSCSGPQMCSPPWLLLPQCLTAPSSCGFYIHASFGLLPFRTVDMLTVRFGQLTVEGLTPSKIRSLSGCSPNARAQRRVYESTAALCSGSFFWLRLPSCQCLSSISFTFFAACSGPNPDVCTEMSALLYVRLKYVISFLISVR